MLVEELVEIRGWGYDRISGGDDMIGGNEIGESGGARG